MASGKALAWLRTVVLAAAVAVPWGGAPAPALMTGAGTVAAVAASAALLAADDAEARSRSSSSSSSRSSSSSYSRSPSSSSSSSNRTPSYTSYGGGAASAADKAISRQNSARALDSYRKSQEPPAAAASGNQPRTSVPPSGSSSRASSDSSSSSGAWNWSSGSGRSARRPSADPYAAYRRYDPRWTPPAFAMQGPSRFGLWDAALLWFLADTLSRPGHLNFFHDNAADPGLQAWRAEADKAAATDAGLQARLAVLDDGLGKLAPTARQPGRLPEDVADKVIPAGAAADDEDEEEASLTDLIVGLIVLALVAAFLIGALVVVYRIWRRIAGRGKTAPAAATSTGESSVFDLFGGKAARKPFRVGMTVSIDPTPFLLAGDAVKAKQPEASASGLTNIQGVGALTSPALTLHRLYLTDSDFLQIHLDKRDQPDECRFFHVIDEIDPANEADWAQWLNPRDGMIGWADFQTPDGRVYQRAWSPGSGRIPPAAFSEMEDTAEGMVITKYTAMLYRAPTGLAEPAPQTEYLLVSAVERDGQAWVEIAAGIDINPASLSLT